jgi:prefoldin subunit 5
MSDHEATREQLLEQISQLRAEVERLRAEIRQIRRDHHETPPHYL